MFENRRWNVPLKTINNDKFNDFLTKSCCLSHVSIYINTRSTALLWFGRKKFYTGNWQITYIPNKFFFLSPIVQYNIFTKYIHSRLARSIFIDRLLIRPLLGTRNYRNVWNDCLRLLYPRIMDDCMLTMILCETRLAFTNHYGNILYTGIGSEANILISNIAVKVEDFLV